MLQKQEEPNLEWYEYMIFVMWFWRWYNFQGLEEFISYLQALSMYNQISCIIVCVSINMMLKLEKGLSSRLPRLSFSFVFRVLLLFCRVTTRLISSSKPRTTSP